MADRDDVVSLGIALDIKGALRDMNLLQRKMLDAMDNMANAAKDVGKVTQRTNKRTVASTEDVVDAVDDVTKAYEDQEKAIADAGKAIKRMAEDSKEAFKDAGKALRSTLRSFWRKDLQGMTEEMEEAMKRASKGMSKGLGVWGAKMRKSGGGMGARGAAMGGITGGALKALGGAVSGIGKVLGALGKVAAILGPISAGLGLALRLFIDLESQAKDFNREVLQSASTVEFLAAAGNNTHLAFAELEETIKGVRNAAFSMENIRFGIKPDEALAAINVLTQEGVTLRSLKNEADLTGESVEKLTGELMRTSVALSRNMGVPLTEIGLLQAEMMHELGMSLKETQLSFVQMNRSASESGIAANKFFKIIQGVSQDLSLYNSRMEDAVKILSMLGKVMNPRNAAKFLSTTMQGLKTMSQDDRLRLNLLTGGKGKDILDRDLKRRQTKVYSDIAKAEGQGRSADDIAAMLKDPKVAEQLWKEVRKRQPHEAGALREAAIELSVDRAAAGKGVYGQAFAMENMGPGATLEMFQTAIAGWGGGKTLMEGAGTLGMTKMAEKLGKSTEELRAMMKMEVAIEEQKRVLMSQGRSAEEVNKMGYDEIIDTMSDGDKENIKALKAQKSLAEQQKDLIWKLSDKFESFVSFMMNEFYNLVEAIASYFAPSEKVRMANLSRDARASGDKELMELVGGASTPGQVHAALMGSAAGKGLINLVGGDKQADIRNRMGMTKQAVEFGTMSQKDADAVLGKLGDELANVIVDQNRYRRAALSNLGDMGTTRTLSEEKGNLGLSDSVFQNAQRQLLGLNSEQSKNPEAVREALSKGGLNNQQIDDYFAKLLHRTSPEALMGMTGNLAKEQAKLAEDTKNNTFAAAENTDKTVKKLNEKNSIVVKFSDAFLRKYEDVIRHATLESLRIALFEYFMYSDLDRTKVATMLKDKTWTPQEFAKQVGESAKVGEKLAPNAAGGVVTSVSGGLAMVRAAAGEGLASVGKGERIVPAGAGVGNITINVNGIGGNDLANVIRARVIDGIYDYKRRERLT